MNIDVDDSRAVDSPTIEEVRKSISELRNCMAAGKDERPVEFLKYGRNLFENIQQGTRPTSKGCGYQS